MYPILRKQILSDIVKLFVVKAPLVARKAQPGQFVIVRIDERGERIPFTIADFDAEEGTITLIFQEVGKSTNQMGLMEVGDSFANVAGPLGHPTKIANYGTVVWWAAGSASPRSSPSPGRSKRPATASSRSSARAAKPCSSGRSAWPSFRMS